MTEPRTQMQNRSQPPKWQKKKKICSVFSSLFNLGFLIYIGYLLSAIYNIITVNEVLKNTYSVRREGE